MLEGYHYQNAYVTRDAEKWITEFEKCAEVDRILRYDGTISFLTPSGPAIQNSKIAFIWIGDLQYELIQPVSGTTGLYRDDLPDDNSLRFHHACMRIPDWDEFRTRVKLQTYPVVMEGGSDALRFLYLDTRPFLGHYLEYVWMTDERWMQLGGL